MKHFITYNAVISFNDFWDTDLSLCPMKTHIPDNGPVTCTGSFSKSRVRETSHFPNCTETFQYPQYHFNKASHGKYSYK